MRNEILNTIIIHNNPVEAQKTEKLIKRLYIDTIVILVNSIEEAQHIIKSLKPDLILLDENSIKNSQVNLCKDLRVGPDCEDFMIIMLTSESNEEYLKNIIEKGCDAYLLNPINEISFSLATSSCSGAVMLWNVFPTITPFKISFISCME